jgi:hypothetical protein
MIRKVVPKVPYARKRLDALAHCEFKYISGIPCVMEPFEKISICDDYTTRTNLTKSVNI